MKRLMLVLLCVMAFATTSYNRALRVPPRSVHFASDAAGRFAVDDARWPMTLRQVGAAPVGLITAAAICGGDAFLLDSRQSIVHRVDLASGRDTAQIGASAGANGPNKPRAMAIDCAGSTLYVIDRTSVFGFDLASGGLVSRFAQPDNFVYTGGTAVLDAERQSLFVPGLWTAAKFDWLQKGFDRMFEGDRLGYKLSLRDGSAAPMFAPITPGCWTFSSDCVNVVLDETSVGGRREWVAAQSVGTDVGVYDESFALRRLIDVRSPRFQDDGRRMSRYDSQVEAIRWNEHNSVIRRVYAFQDHVVTIHTTNTAGWTPGGPINFDVHMNVHALDGGGLVSDVRLADLPIARDERNLYVLDYGSAGRQIGSQNVTLVRYPVASGQLFH